MLKWRRQRGICQKRCNLMNTVYMLKVRSSALHPVTNCSISGQLKLQTSERIAPMSALPQSTFREAFRRAEASSPATFFPTAEIPEGWCLRGAI